MLVARQNLIRKSKNWQEKATTSNAQRTLIPYLKSRGVAKIDQLILTNTDKEHIGDLLEVAKGFPCRGDLEYQKGSLKQKGICGRTTGIKLRCAV